MAEPTDRVATLTPDTAALVIITKTGLDEIEVISDGADEVFYRVDYTTDTDDPEVDDLDEDVFWLPAVPCSRPHPRAGRTNTTYVKLISPGAPKICVQPIR